MKKWLKISLFSLVSFFVFVVLHNLIYAVFKFEEGVAFSLALISAAIFVGSVIYVFILFIKNNFIQKKIKNTDMLLGFSSGCLFKARCKISKETFDLFKKIGANSIELSRLGNGELDFILEKISSDDLRGFECVSLHIVSFKNLTSSEVEERIEKIKQICDKFPIKNIVLHPDTIDDWEIFSSYNLPWAIENTDNRRMFGKTVEDIRQVLSKVNAGFVLDVNHCYTNDPTMKLADDFIENFEDKLCQVHEVYSRHVQSGIAEIVKER